MIQKIIIRYVNVKVKIIIFNYDNLKKFDDLAKLLQFLNVKNDLDLENYFNNNYSYENIYNDIINELENTDDQYYFDVLFVKLIFNTSKI